MRGFFGKIGKFFANPALRTGAVAVVGGAVSAASAGYFGPKGVAVAGAISTVWALFIHRPQDAAKG